MDKLIARRTDYEANGVSQFERCTPAKVVSVHKHDSLLTVSAVIFDHRSCFSESLSRTLEQITKENVLAVQSIEQLQSLAPRLISGRPIILYCAVAGTQDGHRGELGLIRDCLPDARTCVLTDQLDSTLMQLFDELELQGVIPSEYDTLQLAACLKTIAAGVRFLPACMHELNIKQSSVPENRSAMKFNARISRLTPRQQQVLAYIEVGRSNKYIAAELSLCESTVKVHVSELMKRLGASSRTHAVHLAAGIALEHSKP